VRYHLGLSTVDLLVREQSLLLVNDWREYLTDADAHDNNYDLHLRTGRSLGTANYLDAATTDHEQRWFIKGNYQR
jgi:hypothetical protein